MGKTLFTVGLLFLVMVVAVCAAPPGETGEAKWFDMENCAFCKNLVKNPDLLNNMMWEHHDVSNGALTITVVKPEFKQAYMEAQQGMMDVGKKLETGELSIEQVPMCGHCQNYGKLMSMGVKVEYVQGKAADVMLMTSDKPELVAEIKKFTQRNRDEMAKMEEAEKAAKPE